MALILTFLGKGGVGRSVCAIATAKHLASQGKRTLLVTQEASPGFSLLFGANLTASVQTFATNLSAVQLKAAILLEQNWEMLKRLEAQYLRDPFFKAVYGQELSVLPGMDQALVLNALREYDSSGQYDVIVHDGPGDQSSLNMWNLPEGADWYFRRFKKVFQASQFAQSVAPFLAPIAGAIFNTGWSSSSDPFDQPQIKETTNLIAQGKAALNDPNRVRAYLVTTGDTVSIATARYLWGAAQQVNLTVGGVLLNRSEASPETRQAFNPLPVYQLPSWSGQNWSELAEALPDFQNTPQVPAPISVDLANQTVTLFLPSFDKTQIQLTQYGPEVTIEAGDQRRNLALPKELQGRSVTGAKFQDNALIISFG
jgi:anion-transporting  ArsA/GET3 family ATPase